ncbi:proteorhodopsin activator (PAS domain sensor protein), putative [Psychroflexus gondwanensis ACAM 44]|jgi:PAS domain S-box-containing protein|uniref:Proteorhodopsin activator (PAS domain sensor protein), putative n=1 Tax=Psychroflexus gondwanensis ACAM 44 TaxID=1189619 RepID=N1WVW2_9FLAO|nr:PAS domain-containing protein [Psychroflexus gondwanensis]EMY81347.1 proteorhodopsin activator (PAS domain sensor protein), putative [Psychroflexus gondwanensis ACAM 44]
MKRGPLLSWDIYSEYVFNFLKSLKKKKDIERLVKFQTKFNWDFQIEETLFKNEYKAIIITDKNQNIIWVNEGFKDMTGYSLAFVKDKSPKILQGEKTSRVALDQIRTQLATESFCQTSMVNYRKDGSEYMCEIKIYPVHNSAHQVEHYIALENEALLN